MNESKNEEQSCNDNSQESASPRGRLGASSSETLQPSSDRAGETNEEAADGKAGASVPADSCNVSDVEVGPIEPGKLQYIPPCGGNCVPKSVLADAVRQTSLAYQDHLAKMVKLAEWETCAGNECGHARCADTRAARAALTGTGCATCAAYPAWAKCEDCGQSGRERSAK